MKKKTLHLQYNSPVVLSFALVSLGALLLNLFTHGRSNTLLFSVYRSSLLQPLTYPRCFLHVLGHAHVTHDISDMMLRLVVGRPMEAN